MNCTVLKITKKKYHMLKNWQKALYLDVAKKGRKEKLFLVVFLFILLLLLCGGKRILFNIVFLQRK